MQNRIWQKVTVVAPAQVGNALGFFDHAGFLCRETPLDPESRLGAPGDLITVERVADRRGDIRVEYLLRGCDNEGYWDDVRPFSSLADAVARDPGKDIIGRLSRETLKAMRNRNDLPSPPGDDSLSIQVIKHTPNRKVGLGLGSSASSAAVVLAIDHLYDQPLRRFEDHVLRETGRDPHVRLKLMARAEELVSGSRFYDNVAPLAVEGGLIHIDQQSGQDPVLTPLPWPPGLHAVTITPDFSLETKEMRAVLNGANVDAMTASEAAHRRTEVMRGLYTGDKERVIHNAGDGIIEPFRWPLIRGHQVLRRHVEQRRARGKLYSLGISGSGPTVICLAESRQEADTVGQEIHDIWAGMGVSSWWFVHDHNRTGARIIHVS
ncbi:MAG: hypothetical protein H7831_05660 [Magnetococcus sp. WYHC-3]